MVESVDTRDLKSLGRKVVWVQVPLRAPEKLSKQTGPQIDLLRGFFYSLKMI